MKRKGFTLVELLVVIAIIALLLGILMPALAEVQRMAYRVFCGANLKGLGNAFNVYANDNDGDYPRAGGRGSRLSNSGDIGGNWAINPTTVSTTETVEEAVFAGNAPPLATITSCLYYLIKYASTSPKQFVCRGEDAEVFELEWYASSITITELALAWDFGYNDSNPDTPMPGECVSYAYSHPFAHTVSFASPGTYRGFPLSQGMNPKSAVCADRSPFVDENARGVYVEGVDPEDKDPDWDSDDNELVDDDLTLNSACHSRDGQNVLFLDGHVNFEKHPNCAVEKDNIYKFWTGGASSLADATAEIRQYGENNEFRNRFTTPTGIGGGQRGPRHEQDSFLISEFNIRDGKK